MTPSRHGLGDSGTLDASGGLGGAGPGGAGGLDGTARSRPGAPTSLSAPQSLMSADPPAPARCRVVLRVDRGSGCRGRPGSSPALPGPAGSCTSGNAAEQGPGTPDHRPAFGQRVVLPVDHRMVAPPYDVRKGRRPGRRAYGQSRQCQPTLRGPGHGVGHGARVPVSRPPGPLAVPARWSSRRGRPGWVRRGRSRPRARPCSLSARPGADSG